MESISIFIVLSFSLVTFPSLSIVRIIGVMNIAEALVLKLLIIA
ncbi:hypothetical protein ACQKMI_12095 [Lysinibacillus sp. NPDC097214]